jgi:hypothetical protein
MQQTDRGLDQRELDLLTLELAWADALAPYQCPPERFLRGYLNRATLTVVMQVFEIAQRRKFDNADHAGAWVMHELSHRRNADQPLEDRSRGVHFDADGRRVTA